MLGPGIEHEGFNRPDFILDPIEQIDDGIFIPRITGNAFRLTAIGLDLGNQFAERFDLPPGRDRDQAFPGEPPRNRAAQRIPCPDDNGCTRHIDLRTESRCRPWGHRNSAG